MKKLLPILLVAVVALMATSCLTLLAAALATEEEDGVIVFVDSSRHSIDVRVDERHYDVETVRERDLDRRHNLKRAADNMIYVSPGYHHVNVRHYGRTVFNESVRVRSDETKIIYL
jgi:hypothetical protein